MSSTTAAQAIDDAAREAVAAAGLRYTTDRAPGISRRRAGKKSFVYLASDGARITDEASLQRIRKLAIPPAYRDVWICTNPRGHLQATGRDARGRKQYRYHPAWRQVRDASKYERMLELARILPKLRRTVQERLVGTEPTRDWVLSLIVHLLTGVARL